MINRGSNTQIVEILRKKQIKSVSVLVLVRVYLLYKNYTSRKLNNRPSSIIPTEIISA